MLSAGYFRDIELPSDELRRLFGEISTLVAEAIDTVPTKTQSGATVADLEALLPLSAPEAGGGGDAVRALVQDVYLPHIRNYRHPLHYGHQRPAPLAATVITDLAANAFNPTVTMLEGGPISVTLERRVMDWFRQLAGFPKEGCGTLLNGGAESVLTALLCARESVGPGRVLASGDAHYSVARAIHVLGLPPETLVGVPVDNAGRIDIRALHSAADEIAARGGHIMAVVANAGSTANAAFDDLASVGAVARKFSAWYHVDGSHGASVLMSPRLRSKLRGVEFADSLSWNPHKLLWVASPCAVLLVRDTGKLISALAPGTERASYVLPSVAAAHSIDERPDPLRLTIACTRYFAALRLCAAILAYGTAGLGQRIERMHDLACDLFAKLNGASDFRCYAAPELNMVCFRHIPREALSTHDVNEHNKAIRRDLAAGSQAYLTGVQLGEHYWLRAQVMSPNTDEKANARLLTLVRASAAERSRSPIQ